MNLYRRFKGRVSMRKNPKFGTRCYFGAHRYVYYMDGQPRYYFSDRPYTLDDASTWKRRNLISNIVMSVCFVWAFFGCVMMNVHDPDVLMISVLCLGVGLYSVVNTVLFIKIKPEEDPMLKSYQCTSDIEKPREDTCKFCGGIYSSGAHAVCPHCNNPV